MIICVVGSGGKTTLIKNLARQYRAEGKTVFVTTSTHLRIEADTLLTDDPEVILRALREEGYEIRFFFLDWLGQMQNFFHRQ